MERGCPTSYEVFLRRLCNIAVNKLNKSFSDAIFVLGSIDARDLTEACKDAKCTIPSDRALLINAVREQHRRATEVLVAASLPVNKFYVINGDHNHMTSVVEAVARSTSKRVNVIYLDLSKMARIAALGKGVT